MNSLGGWVEKCIYLVWGIELGNYQYNNEDDQSSVRGTSTVRPSALGRGSSPGSVMWWLIVNSHKPRQDI